MNRSKKYATLILSSLLGVSLLSGAVYFALSSDAPHQTKAEGCVAGSLSSGVIDLNDTPPSEIRSYYSSLNSLPVSERQGTNLLKNLKPILKNMTYYSYDAAWKIYEITDREWALSPASEDTYGNYNAATNKYENYVYSSSNSSTKNNPYVHTL